MYHNYGHTKLLLHIPSRHVILQPHSISVTGYLQAICKGKLDPKLEFLSYKTGFHFNGCMNKKLSCSLENSHQYIKFYRTTARKPMSEQVVVFQTHLVQISNTGTFSQNSHNDIQLNTYLVASSSLFSMIRFSTSLPMPENTNRYIYMCSFLSSLIYLTV